MLNISNNIVLGTYPFLIYTLITFWIIIVLHLILFFNLTCTSLWGYGTDLCEDWWFMMRNHSGVFTVKRDRTCVIVEGLFRLHHMIVQFFNSTLKYAAKVPWNQVSSYGLVWADINESGTLWLYTRYRDCASKFYSVLPVFLFLYGNHLISSEWDWESESEWEYCVQISLA